MNNINTKDLEKEYQRLVTRIENAVSQMIESGILPNKFAVLSPRDLTSLAKVLYAMQDDQNIIYIFDEIQYAKEIDELKSDLIAEGLSYSNWIDGTILWDVTDTDSLVEEVFNIPSGLEPFINYDRMFEEIKGDYTLVCFRGFEYWFK